MSYGYGDQYVTNPVPEDATPLGALSFVWYSGTRGPEHAKNWRRKLEREFPELYAAIEAVTNPNTWADAEQIVQELDHEHMVEYTLGSPIGRCAVKGCNYMERRKDPTDG
jgi:hypothetical protein